MTLRLSTIHFMFKYTFGITTTLLEFFRSQKNLLMVQFNFDKTSYNDFVLTRNGFLTLLGAPKDFLRLIIICYMFKYSFRIKTNLLDIFRS